MSITMIRRARALAIAVLAGCAPATMEVQPAAAPAPTLDRTVQPASGPVPDVNLPTIHRRTLSNGLELWVAEHRELPVATVRLIVNAGSAAEEAGEAGLATMTAAMLDEGTEQRTALEIADELNFLGAGFGTGASYDAAFVTLAGLTRTLPQALDVVADVVINPVFPVDELERVRRERFTSILQALDQPTSVASDQVALRIYGPDHPYGRPPEGTVTSLTGLTADELREFYRTYYRPNNASLLMVGDISPDEAVRLAEEAFGEWEPAEVPRILYPSEPAPQEATRIYLIDKPGAAQSEIRIGHVGVARDNPDYFPLLVLNTILGGQFSSRINLNLREDKGYTYGARSAFSMRREPGPFLASAGVQTPSTKESVIEFMRELEGIRGPRPLTQAEIDFAKASLVRREPLQVETPQQIAGRLEDLVLFDLPADYFDTYTERVAAVTKEDLERVARRYLDPERFAIVIVGDRSRVEAGLRELPYPLEIITLETPTLPRSPE